MHGVGSTHSGTLTSRAKDESRDVIPFYRVATAVAAADVRRRKQYLSEGLIRTITEWTRAAGIAFRSETNNGPLHTMEVAV